MSPVPDTDAHAPLNPPGAIDWRRNLFVIWLSQMFSIAAFSFTLPFVPVYLREARIVPPEDVNSYAAWFQTSASIALLVMSPIWGALADRYGRKMMLVRANLGGAVALFLMGTTTDIHWLLALRVFQGAFTGTTPAAQTLVTVYTPPKRQAFALGFMAAAIAIGDLAGKWFGAEAAATWGVPTAFKISGGMLLFSTFFVLAFAREKFVPPGRDPASSSISTRERARHPYRAMARIVLANLPLMGTFTLLAFTITSEGSMLPLYFNDLGMHITGAASHDDPELARWTYRATGNIMAAGAVASALTATITGVIMDRWRGTWYVGAMACGMMLGLLGTAYGRELPEWLGFTGAATAAWIMPLMFGSRILVGLCFSALNSAQLVWTGRCASAEQRGKLFGLSASARACGWIPAPILAAAVANHYHAYPPIYLFAAACTLGLLPLMVWMSIRYPLPQDK